MFDEKSDLYRAGWLDLVFEGRNKQYGAYQLRLHNGETTLKALVLASLLMTGMVTGSYLYNRYVKDKAVAAAPAPQLRESERIVVMQPKKEQPKKEDAAPKPKPVAPKKINTRRFVTPVVVPAPQVQVEPPSNADLKNAQVGLTDVIGEDPGNKPALIEDTPSIGGNGTGKDEEAGNGIFASSEVMPEFPGGLAAFGRYLGNNLRYPSIARENEISGRVVVSFVVEKNGDLSNIKVLRGIGGGCDEEAVRVLSKAPAWKPGKQNGQAVRVAYTVPIMFNLEK